MTDRLIDNLKRADAVATSRDESDAVALADRAMLEADRRIRRRTMMNVAGAACAILMFVVGITHYSGVSVSPNSPVDDPHARAAVDGSPAIDVERVRAEIDELDRQIAGTQRVVSRLQASERERHLRNRRPHVRVSTLTESQIQSESTAQLLLLQGDRLANDTLTQRLAPDAYRRIINLFPESAAAEDARRRLERETQGDHV